MANVILKQEQLRQFGGFAPFGNQTVLSYKVKTDSTGAAINSNSPDPLAAGDVVDLGPLPEGMRLDDAQVIVTTGMTSTITGSLGFKYEDGVDSSEAPQDAAYFGTGIDIAAAGRKRAAGTKLLTLAKPARLILTTAVAANAKVSEISVLVSGELTGPK